MRWAGGVCPGHLGGTGPRSLASKIERPRVERSLRAKRGSELAERKGFQAEWQALIGGGMSAAGPRRPRRATRAQRRREYRNSLRTTLHYLHRSLWLHAAHESVDITNPNCSLKSLSTFFISPFSFCSLVISSIFLRWYARTPEKVE